MSNLESKEKNTFRTVSAQIRAGQGLAGLGNPSYPKDHRKKELRLAQQFMKVR